MKFVILFLWILYVSFILFRDIPTYFDNFAQGYSILDMIWWWCEVLKIRIPGNIAGWMFGKMYGVKGKRIDKK